MLNPEQARETLASIFDSNWANRALTSLKELTPEARSVGRDILHFDEKDRPLKDWQQQSRARQRAQEGLVRLDMGERHSLWGALFGPLGSYVEKTWLLWDRLPYQQGWSRRSFRLPRATSSSLNARSDWTLRLLETIGGYPQSLTWLAAWAPYLAYGAPDIIGLLLAAALDEPGTVGDEIHDILVASAQGEHEVGMMGRHVTRALLVAERPGGWDFIEKLLIAAQRQEGLRQVILETVDEAHPEAFRRMVRLILEQDLVRFSATVRAVDVWFGFGWDAPQARLVNQALAQMLDYLDHPASRKAALDGGDGQAVFLALWAIAFENGLAPIQPATRLLADSAPERRFAATHLLTQLALPEAQPALREALEDDDLRVVTRAMAGLTCHSASSDLFDQLERLLPRFPEKSRELEPLVWPWMGQSASQEMVIGHLFLALGSRPPHRLFPYLARMSPHHRSTLIDKIGAAKRLDAESRTVLLALAGDRSEWVREKALKVISKGGLAPEEAPRLEALLTRKSGSLRRGIISLLVNQDDDASLESADRLLREDNVLQRGAGLELLSEMVQAERSAELCRNRARRHEQRANLTDAERRQLDILLDVERQVPTLDDALGLLNPADRTRPVPPRLPATKTEREGPRSAAARLKAGLDRVMGRDEGPIGRSPAATAILKALDDLVHEQRQTPLLLRYPGDIEREVLLGNLPHGFPRAYRVRPGTEEADFPLADLWETWWMQRPAEQRSHDGMELIFALASIYGNERFIHSYPTTHADWTASLRKKLFPDSPQLRYSGMVYSILEWLLQRHPVQDVTRLLDAVEYTFTLVPPDQLAHVPEQYYTGDWRDHGLLLGWLTLARAYRQLYPAAWKDADHTRLWRLLRWRDEPGTGVPRLRADFAELLAAWEAGGATDADVLDHLLGPRSQRGRDSYFMELRALTGRKPSALVERYPRLQELANLCRDRILEIELQRGDLPTEASAPALALRYVEGMETVLSLVRASNRESWVRGWTRDGQSRASVYSHLLRICFPAEADSPEAFAARAAELRVPERRLIELAIFAPQWTNHVAEAVGWPSFTDAVWWIHAHTKDNSWYVDAEIREAWNAEINDHTPLTGEDLLQGAVDVAWFHRVYDALGEGRWLALYDAAKFASGGGGHKRAQLFADAMLGRESEDALATRIRSKRHQDTVRAIGLVPLPDGAERARAILRRYELIQEFLRGSRRFGSQRQASEKLAATIAMDNLARTAGYADPIRLQWAMEAEATRDLAEAPQVVTVGEVSVSLAINEAGAPVISVLKGGKRLKNVPAKLKKDPDIAALVARKQDLQRQSSRMRLALEQAMCRGDLFSGSELRSLAVHPILAPMLEETLFIGEGILGYPTEQGNALLSHDGTLLPVGHHEQVRVAHPHDLLRAGTWHLWQRDCFLAERVQPFKQIFRELYVLTGTEKGEKNRSLRYAGHQVQPKQALALLGGRGWVTHPDEGIRRTFHDERITAWLNLENGWFSPTEVEGLTLDSVHFSRQGEWKAMPLEEVPPRLFSEVMRDLDLVVSVAHQGGVDPEASASTVEMRATLAMETCHLLGMTNVRLQGSHVLIEGALGSYSVHLGSATVHRQPGGALCIVPVHSQHRGRIFLPFADDDPKSAEVLSKIILLARDSLIQDPTILEQITRG